MAVDSKRPTFLQALCFRLVDWPGPRSTFCSSPIDTVKTRLQSPQGFSAAGGFRGIYKGVGSVGVGSAPGAAAFFAAYEALKQNSPLPSHLAPLTHLVAASAAEVVRNLFSFFSCVREHRPRHMGLSVQSSLSAAKIILASDGWRGFYRGFGSTIMREPLYAHEAAVCGSIAGGIAAALTTPLDVLKTRVMLDIRDPTKEKLPSLAARLKGIYVGEGIPALFSGVVPRTLWISAGGAVFLGMYEWAVHGLMGW
ncbi:mitochondrial carrier domain-containing protein [Mycena rebaudengoi]|nr:mitochondrial carrier domain-containing protein [Mycena rebaudengoi]